MYTVVCDTILFDDAELSCLLPGNHVLVVCLLQIFSEVGWLPRDLQLSCNILYLYLYSSRLLMRHDPYYNSFVHRDARTEQLTILYSLFDRLKPKQCYIIERSNRSSAVLLLWLCIHVIFFDTHFYAVCAFHAPSHVPSVVRITE